jgi:hypothetical protein
MSEDMSLIGLREAIRSLRSELSSAMLEGAGDELRFRVGPVELEFLVEITREATGEGGVRFWVASLGAKGSTSNTASHRVKLVLSPVTREGKDFEVTDAVRGRPE